MLIIDEEIVKVGGVILPGIFKSFEVQGSVQMEEVDVKGKSQKPKQATGYSDSKLNIEIRLYSDDKEKEGGKTALEKLQIITNIFRKPGQKKPTVYEIVSEHTSIRGITKVVFKDLTSKEKSGRSEIAVSLVFWEYIPITITTSKGASASTTTTTTANSSTANLNNDYVNYLSNRGKAPKIQDKTTRSPARDNPPNVSRYMGRTEVFPY